MDAEIFAEWLRRQGTPVIRSTSSYWLKAGPGIYQAFPFHWIINPEEKELSEVIRRNKALGLRYSTSLENPVGKISYHVVCEDPSYDLDLLPRKPRHDTRRGLEYAPVQKITMSRLANEGWLLRQETITRQGRVKAESEKWWRGLCKAAEDLPGFEAWGAIHENKLVSSLLAYTMDDCYTFLYFQSATSHMRYGINNAVVYHATSEALKRPGITHVFVGYQSLDAPDSVDRFKFRMGYHIKPVRQRVLFHPWLQPLINPVSHAGLRAMRRLMPDNPILTKAEGMLRFYLQGRLPLDKQSWPEALTVAHAGYSKSDLGNSA